MVFGSFPCGFLDVWLCTKCQKHPKALTQSQSGICTDLGEQAFAKNLVLLKVIFYFHPYLGAFWGFFLFFLGFLSKSKCF